MHLSQFFAIREESSSAPFASLDKACSPSRRRSMAARHSSSGRDPYETRMCPGAPNALHVEGERGRNTEIRGGGGEEGVLIFCLP